jgi:uncharacterized membrane protein
MTEAVAVLGMALAAYSTRVAGLLAVRRVTLEGRAITFLDAASIAIIASLTVIGLARLSWHVWIATAAAITVMHFSRSVLLSMAAAVLFTSILRSLF